VGEGDAVIGVAVSHGNDEIVLGTANGPAIRFNETDVRLMGRTAGGVRGINLREGDEVIGMAVADPMATLLTLCENGYGKRTSFEEYRLQSRGGYGVINIKTTERNGKVVAMKSVRDADEIMLITHNGMIVRTGVSEIRSIGRATQGVRVMTLKSGDSLVAVARVLADDQSGQEQLGLADADAPAGTVYEPADAGQEETPAEPDTPPDVDVEAQSESSADQADAGDSADDENHSDAGAPGGPDDEDVTML